MSALVDYGDSDDELDKKDSFSTCSNSVISNATSELEGGRRKFGRFDQKAIDPELDRTTHISRRSGATNNNNETDFNVSNEETMTKLKKNIEKLLRLRRQGRTINQYISESQQFQNPYCLEQIMKVCSISPYCSNYSEELYDPSAIEVWEISRLQRIEKEQLLSQSRSVAQRLASPVTSTTSVKKDSLFYTQGGGQSIGTKWRTNKWDIKSTSECVQDCSFVKNLGENEEQSTGVPIRQSRWG